jgi:hypothetical protein
MTCIPGTGIRGSAAHGAAFLLAAILLTSLSACGVPASDAEANENDSEHIYRVTYRVTPDPAARGAHVEMSVSQRSSFLREMDMPLRDGQISNVGGDGEVSLRDGRVVWKLPESGGKLRWFATINSKRNGGTYDAYIERDWALFRGMDIIPSARTRVLAGSASRTTLAFDLPDGWSSVTPYFGRDDVYEVTNAGRNFVTPTGWIVLGNIGVRSDTIGHVLTKVAGPTGHSVRRVDMLALMRWNLPELLRLLPDYPDRLTFVSAAEPMWRGGLSAPGSFYIHADRPLISENATSTLLHEAVHVGMRLVGETGADWIVEGFAEYYSLEVLRRSGTISNERYRTAHTKLQSWGRRARQVCADRSSGSNTARAVGILAEVNAEIRKATREKKSLDDVLTALAAHKGKITVERFRDIVEEIAGQTIDALKPGRLPGCS